MVNLFVYGTLIDPDIQVKVIGRVIQGTPFTLEGYVKSIHEFPDGTYPIIFPGDGSVEGFILNLTEDELTLCDNYEGELYKRISFQTNSFGNVWVYIPNF